MTDNMRGARRDDLTYTTSGALAQPDKLAKLERLADIDAQMPHVRRVLARQRTLFAHAT